MDARTIEFHFQEGFSGECIEIAVDGKNTTSFEARTRLQIGLAHILPLVLNDGQRVSIAIPPLSLREQITIEPTDRWFTINLVDHRLAISRARSSPGYV